MVLGDLGVADPMKAASHALGPPGRDKLGEARTADPELGGECYTKRRYLNCKCLRFVSRQRNPVKLA